jgi:hypothetical protein
VVQVLIVMGITSVMLAMLMMVIVQTAKMTQAMNQTLQDTAMSWGRLARQATDLSVPIDGVTITRDPGMPASATCQLYSLTTKTKSGVVLEQFVTRKCVVQ